MSSINLFSLFHVCGTKWKVQFSDKDHRCLRAVFIVIVNWGGKEKQSMAPELSGRTFLLTLFFES